MEDLQSYLDKALKEVQLAAEDKAEYTVDYNIEEEIRELLVSSRMQVGLTQKELAEKTGISQANISKMENGGSCPTIQTLKKLADGLGKRLTVDFLDTEGEG